MTIEKSAESVQVLGSILATGRCGGCGDTFQITDTRGHICTCGFAWNFVFDIEGAKEFDLVWNAEADSFELREAS